MRITYSSKKLQQLCEDERTMHKKRPDIEKKLRLRIKAIEVAETLGDLSKNDPLGRWHRLSGDREGQWAGKVSGNERIIIEPSCEGVKILDVIEQLAASEVNVREITDYHD